MRPQVPHVCSHCQSTKSPLWRRGANMEVLCNACGLYWKHHNAYRPLSLKAAADRKSSEASSEPSSSASMNLAAISAASAGSEVLRNYSAYYNQQAHQGRAYQSGYASATTTPASSTYQHPLAYTNPQLVTSSIGYSSGEGARNKAGPLRSSNILLAGPSNSYMTNYGTSESYASYKRTVGSNIVLPPLEYKGSTSDSSAGPVNLASSVTVAGGSVVGNNNFSNPSANQRQLSPAQILPNLKQVIGNLISSSPEKIVPEFRNSSNFVPLKPAYSSASINPAAAAAAAAAYKSAILPSNTTQFGPKAGINGGSNNMPIKYIIHRGMTIYQGDHVSIRGLDSQVYFAVVLDFWLTDSGKRYFIFRWLLPDPKASITAPLQDRFSLGPHHDRVESMDSVLNVFYSPYRDECTSDDIRKKFLLPASEDFSSNSTSLSASSSDALNNAVDPPAHLVRTIKSISEFDRSSSTSPVQVTPTAASAAAVAISAPTAAAVSQQESSEIAAKMLLSMN